MPTCLLTNAKIVLPGRVISGDVLVQDGLIASVAGAAPQTADTAFDLSGTALCPGFIDIHCHGAAGVDVNEADADGLFQIAEFLARKGVTAWLPTLVPDSDANFGRAVAEVEKLMLRQGDRPVAQALGIHYEGVFANDKMCGALRPQFFLKYSKAEFQKLPKLRNGVHMMTFAPEIEGGLELAAELAAEGWIGSIGHTSAPAAVLDAAAEAGAKHITHFFNAMSGLHHREIGVVGWGLSNEEVTFDIIADGIHVAPQVLKLACKAKGFEKVSLISDSIAPTGSGDGEYRLWGNKVTVKNGSTSDERGSIAGSVITLSDAVRTMLGLQFSTEDAVQMASTNPSKLLGITDDRGTIDTGKRADLVALDQDGNITLSMIGGIIV